MPLYQFDLEQKAADNDTLMYPKFTSHCLLQDRLPFVSKQASTHKQTMPHCGDSCIIVANSILKTSIGVHDETPSSISFTKIFWRGHGHKKQAVGIRTTAWINT